MTNLRYAAILILEHPWDANPQDIVAALKDLPDIVGAQYVETLDDGRSTFAILYDADEELAPFDTLEEIVCDIERHSDLIDTWEAHPNVEPIATETTTPVEQALHNVIEYYNNHKNDEDDAPTDDEDAEEMD